MMSLTGMVLSNGAMAIPIKGILKMGLSKGQAVMYGEMDQVMKVIGAKVKLKEMVFIGIVMGEFMKGNGNRI